MTAGIPLLLTLLTIGQQTTLPVSVRGELAEPEFRIILSWNVRAEFTTSDTTRELTIRFDRPVGSPALDFLARQFPQWIDGAASGYDSLLIRSTQEVDYTVERNGNDVLVRLTLRGAAPISEATERKDDLRLDILRAQLLSRTGKDKEAIVLLDRIEADYPAETQVGLNRAEIHLRHNRWREALADYKLVMRLDPGNESAEDGLNNMLIAAQRSNIRADAARRVVQDAQREIIQRISGHFLFRDAFRIGYSAAHDEMHFRGVRTDAYQGEVFGQYDFLSGALLRGGFLASERTRGGTFQFEVPVARGVFHVQADYQRPFWEFAEGIEENGTRDRVEISRQQDIAQGLVIRGGAAANRYGLGTQKDSATSVAYEAGVVKTFGYIRIVGFEYLFDGEYRKTYNNPSLPLVSRQVHGADGFFDFDFRRRLRMEGFGGYTFDQKGGEGPFYGGRITFHRGWFEAQMAYDHRLNSVATGQVDTRYDAHILWRF